MTERSYNQYCGVSRALDLVGERWALLVVRDLVLGPKRFTDLKAGLPGIGTNVLSSRLKELERGGVVRRRALPPPAASAVYELTAYGRDLEPILLDLGRWGLRTLGDRTGDQALRSGWIGVALRALGRAEGCAGVRGTVEFALEDGTFHARLDDGTVVVADGPSVDPTLVIEGGNEPLLALLIGAADADALAAAGSLRFRGDRGFLAAVLGVFSFADAAVTPEAP
jgi:DNA-binding HxlR family transcriptional regulator